MRKISISVCHTLKSKSVSIFSIKLLFYYLLFSANASDEEGRTGLHLACCNANSACVKILLSHGARVNCFDKQKLAAPLFCAVASGGGNESETVVDLLLSAGADINLGNFQVLTTLLRSTTCLTFFTCKRLVI